MTSYTEREKMLLTRLVKENNIVENKKTDNASLEEKRMAWELICAVYNSHPEVNCQRTPEQIKKLWSNLKQRKRKQNTEMRHNISATGGGARKKPALDDVLDFVQDVSPDLDVTVPCQYDSTAIFDREQGLLSWAIKEEQVEIVDETDDITVPLITTERSRASSTSDTSSTGVPLSSKNSEVIPASKVFSSSHTLRDISTPNTAGHLKRSTVSESVLPERNARLQRVERGMVLDQELHDLRMRVLQEELEIAQLEKQKVASEALQAEMKHKILQEELLKVQFEKQKAEAEAEQATLSLENCKKQIGGA